jgi:autotransporter translocation and assembly factor TamB
MRSAGRILKLALIGAGALIGLAALAAAFLLFTTPGAKLVLSVANGRDLPVRAKTIDGALARRFVLRDVEVSVGPLHASLDTLIVAWRPMALRHHRVDVEAATIAGARVRVTPVAADTTTRAARKPSAGKRWVVTADRVRVRNASVDAPGDVHLRRVDIAGSGGPDGYRAEVQASGSVWRLAEVEGFVRASGNARATAVDSLDLRALGGVVRGDAFVRWEPGVSWRGRLDGDSLRVGELAGTPEDWLSAVSFRATGTGQLGEDSTRAAIDWKGRCAAGRCPRAGVSTSTVVASRPPTRGCAGGAPTRRCRAAWEKSPTFVSTPPSPRSGRYCRARAGRSRCAGRSRALRRA